MAKNSLRWQAMGETGRREVRSRTVDRGKPMRDRVSGRDEEPGAPFRDVRDEGFALHLQLLHHLIGLQLVIDGQGGAHGLRVRFRLVGHRGGAAEHTGKEG